MTRGRLYDSCGRYLGQVNNFYTRLGEFRMTLELDNGNTLQFDPGELLRDRQGDWHVRGAKEHVLDSLRYAHLADRICEEAFKKEAATMTAASIKKVIFNPPATIVFWSDGKKTVVKCSKNESFDPEKGLAMAIVKRTQGNCEDYYKDISKWCVGASAQKAKEKSKNDILDVVLELIASAKNTIKNIDKVRSSGLAFSAGQIDALLKLGYATDFIEDLKKN